MNLKTCLIRYFGPQKEKFSQGVTALQLLSSGNLLLGTGEGSVAELKGAPSFKRVRSEKVAGAITSVSLRGSGSQVCCAGSVALWQLSCPVCYVPRSSS